VTFSAPATFYYAFPRNPLTPGEEKQRDPHQQICGNEQYQRLIMEDKPD
jgi:hypothetical protein